MIITQNKKAPIWVLFTYNGRVILYQKTKNKKAPFGVLFVVKITIIQYQRTLESGRKVVNNIPANNARNF